MVKEKDFIEIDGEEYSINSIKTIGTPVNSWGVPCAHAMIIVDGGGEYIVLKKSLKQPTRYIACKQ